MVATKIKSKMNLAAHRHDDLGGKIGESSTPPMVAQILHRTRHFRDRYSDDCCYIAIAQVCAFPSPVKRTTAHVCDGGLAAHDSFRFT
jgi:hypothetical protein